jgi:hypothetical protein
MEKEQTLAITGSIWKMLIHRLKIEKSTIVPLKPTSANLMKRL